MWQNPYMETPTEEDSERAITVAAFKIVAVLDGMRLCDAIRAGERAGLIIKTAHKVNAKDDEVMAFRREFENAPSQ